MTDEIEINTSSDDENKSLKSQLIIVCSETNHADPKEPINFRKCMVMEIDGVNIFLSSNDLHKRGYNEINHLQIKKSQIKWDFPCTFQSKILGLFSIEDILVVPL